MKIIKLHLKKEDFDRIKKLLDDMSLVYFFEESEKSETQIERGIDNLI